LVISFYLVELFGNGMFFSGGFIADIRLRIGALFQKVWGKAGKKIDGTWS
jgi:hypothetical protein